MIEAECHHHLDQNSFTKSLQGRKIYKDQCVRCFSDATHPDGLFVCLKCFNGFCSSHREIHNNTHHHPIYLRITNILKVQEQTFQITKLAIGVQGGAVGEDQYDTHYQVWCHPCNRHIPEGDKSLQAQVKSLINTDSPYKKQSLASWEVQINPCEHTLTLQQQLINKNLQHCSNCQLSTNLWLCLTCGNTGCGRKNWDGTGGNGHGIAHFQQSGHPLVVKLGTITAEGNASLYCYNCNNDVKDDLLVQHLIYLGIEVKNQKKTQKTVVQINLDLNINFALSKLLQNNAGQVNLYGAGLTGINNIGNSCYLNSVLQSLNSLPQFRQQYYKKGQAHIAQCKKIPSQCFYCQVSKIFWGLNSGNYSKHLQRTKVINDVQVTTEYQQGIKPFDFKLLIAKDNSQFNSSRQQDALQYLQWIFDRLDKQQPFIGDSTTKYFNYQSLNRLVCEGCNGYKLIEMKTNQWKFPVPLPNQQHINAYYQQLDKEDSEIKKAKLCEDPQYDVKMDECLGLLKQGDAVVANCPKCKGEKVFVSKQFFKTTPKYLLAIPNRFIVQKWVPKKLNALIDVKQSFNISDFMIHNAVPAGSKLDAEVQTKKYSEDNVNMLVAMGFTENAAKRALIQTKDNLQAASNWLMQNMDNYQINLPLNEVKQQKSIQLDPNAIAQVMDLGFDESQAKIALLQNANNQQAAVEWLFSVDGDVSSYKHLLNQAKGQPAGEEYVKPAHIDYELKAVIIHLGKSVHSGHYVAYVRNEKGWVLFNDEKVTTAANPVFGKGYIYLYEGK